MGGELLFRQDLEEEELHSSEGESDEYRTKEFRNKPAPACWSSSGKGSFACWFATEPHSVKQVTRF